MLAPLDCAVLDEIVQEARLFPLLLFVISECLQFLLALVLVQALVEFVAAACDVEFWR